MGPLGTGIVMGLAGTLAMDIWAQVLHRAFGQPLPNWAMPGLILTPRPAHTPNKHSTLILTSRHAPPIHPRNTVHSL